MFYKRPTFNFSIFLLVSKKSKIHIFTCECLNNKRNGSNPKTRTVFYVTIYLVAVRISNFRTISNQQRSKVLN